MAANDWEVVSRTPFTPPSAQPDQNEWGVVSRAPITTAPAPAPSGGRQFVPPGQEDPQAQLRRFLADRESLKREISRLRQDDPRLAILQQELAYTQQAADYYRQRLGAPVGTDTGDETQRLLKRFPAQPADQSMLRQVADVPLGVAKGFVQGVRMMADIFGAGSSASNTIRSAENYIADLMSAQAKNDQQTVARIMKDAEDKGVADQVRAGIQAFTVAPIDTLSSAFGTAGPVILAALGAKVLGAGALASAGISALTGAGMGAGVIKGSIYDETKKALIEAGAAPEEAERRAQLAQAYDGKNLDQILLGTVLGGAAAVGPLEKGTAGLLARKILGKVAVEESAEAAAKGAIRRRVGAGVAEAVPEAGQAFQERTAQNIALQREGFQVPTYRGAAGAATLEGIAGGALGAALGGGKPTVAPPQEKIEPTFEERPVAPTPEARVEPSIEGAQPTQMQRMFRELEETSGLAPAEAPVVPEAAAPVAEAPSVPPVAETAPPAAPVVEAPVVPPAAPAEAPTPPKAPTAEREFEPAPVRSAGFRAPTPLENRNINSQAVYDLGNGARVHFTYDDFFISAPGSTPGQETGVIRLDDTRKGVFYRPELFPAFIPQEMRQPLIDAQRAVYSEKDLGKKQQIIKDVVSKISQFAPKIPSVEAAPPVAPAEPRGLFAPPQSELPPLPQAEPASPKPPTAPALTSPEVTRLQAAYDKAKASLDAIGSEPAKPSSESRYFGSAGREGAAPEVVKAYDEKVKAYNSWRRKYSKLKKAEVDAANELFRAKQATPTEVAPPQVAPTQAEPVSTEGRLPDIVVPAGFKAKKGRKPQLVFAARALAEGKITKDQYDEYVERYNPIKEVLGGEMELPIEDALMTQILTKEIPKKKDPKLVNAPIADGTRVGLRMDIPALDWGRENGVNGSVVSIHEGSDPKNKTQGENISYKSTGRVTNVVFAPRSEEDAFKIAQQKEPETRTKKTGEVYLKEVAEKKPQQTIEGDWVNTSPEETLRLVREHFNDPNWVQVSLDPLRHSYFYARDSKRPVISADEALQVGRFVLVKNPVYGDRQQFLYNIEPILSRPVTGTPARRLPSFKREVAKLRDQHTRGLMTDEEFARRIDALIDEDSRRKVEKDIRTLREGRVRGGDYIRQRLLEAVRRGDLSGEAVDLAEWFIINNPQLVEDLGVSIRAPREGGVGGMYSALPRVMFLVKEGGSDNTVVHEILHHLERMMPANVQSAIRREWTKQFLKAQKNAKTPTEQLYFNALSTHHFDNRPVSFDTVPTDLRELFFKTLRSMDIEGGSVDGSALARHLLINSDLDIGNYQYYNPSEFWAVNGSDIVRGRYEAIRGGVLTRLKNWLGELGQKIKSVFGFNSDAPIIRALDSLARSDGRFVTTDLLSQAQDMFSIEKKAKPAPREAAPAKTIEPSKIDREREAWTVGRDELGRPNFGLGAKAYDTVARLANIALDKIAMKPISPELSRAMRNMKVQIDKTQKQVGAIGTELAKMSPQERALISDVIEGELQAGINPSQEVLNNAAAMQSLMTKQSQELVRLGMLSKEAANRWENKYLPRFYEKKLGDETKAWAKAAKRLLMKEPTMQGIKGKQLKSRGMYKAVYVEDLPEWIAQGWEQRDPSFNPKTSTETVVWRDYTREEREKMGEIRDAMFRFVMGYNASQRDIALGRLYENLAENYASRSPAEGLVPVPETKVEGTGAYRYGKLAGMYVPKEIKDHLVWNDQEMANGLYKLYRAGLGRWKEGKTVLNPTAHANNVFSNFTMAHFAGVSYWDVHKYAGALRDFVKNNDRLKEAEDIGLFTGTFSQAEMVENMPPELKKLANMTESQVAKYGDKAWDLLSYTIEWDGKKYGVRPAMKWMYENEDFFFRYLIYSDARNRGLEPEDAREYSNQFIFTYDDLPRGARILRDVGMPFFSYTYKVVPVIARTALEYPWRFAAPAAAVYTINAMMYAMAASLGEDEDDWWGKVLYKYVTDEEFRKRANKLEEEERKNLPPWMKGKSSLGTEKAIRLGMDDVTGLPLFLDISRIFPGGDLLDAENNAGGVALLQPLVPSNPVFTTLVAMFANKDMFLGKDIVNDKTDTAAEQARKRAAWLWKQWAPSISVGNYHFDRAMNTIANMTGEPVTVDAGPMGVVDYTGVGKDGLPVIPKYAAMQTFGIKVRPYDLETSEEINQAQQNKLIKELSAEIRRIDRLEEKGAMSSKAADILRTQAERKKELLEAGLTIEGEEEE